MTQTATAAETALAFITENIENGATVYVSTSARHTKITPKTFKAWAAAATPLFKIDSGGNLRMARGKSYDIIATKHHLLVRLTCEK